MLNAFNLSDLAYFLEYILMTMLERFYHNRFHIYPTGKPIQ